MSRIHVFFMFGSLLFNTISCMQMFTPNGTSSPVNDSIITNAVDSTERVDRFVANNVPNNNSSRNNYPVNKFLLMRNNPTILNKNIGANVLTSFIYSLTFVPLFVAITSIFSPWPHGMWTICCCCCIRLLYLINWLTLSPLFGKNRIFLLWKI